MRAVSQTVDELPDFNKISFPSLPPLPLAAVLPGASAGALALLSKFLRYDPETRISAEQALLDPWFFTAPLPADASSLLRHMRKEGGSGSAERGSSSAGEPQSFDAEYAPLPWETATATATATAAAVDVDAL